MRRPRLARKARSICRRPKRGCAGTMRCWQRASCPQSPFSSCMRRSFMGTRCLLAWSVERPMTAEQLRQLLAANEHIEVSAQRRRCTVQPCGGGPGAGAGAGAFRGRRNDGHESLLAVGRGGQSEAVRNQRRRLRAGDAASAPARTGAVAMKSVLLGATGAIGESIAAELRKRGESYRAVGRDRASLDRAFGSDPLAEIAVWNPDDPASVKSGSA